MDRKRKFSVKALEKKTSEVMDIFLLGNIPIDTNNIQDGDKGLLFIIKNIKSKAAEAFNRIRYNIRKKIEENEGKL